MRSKLEICVLIFKRGLLWQARPLKRSRLMDCFLRIGKHRTSLSLAPILDQCEVVCAQRFIKVFRQHRRTSTETRRKISRASISTHVPVRVQVCSFLYGIAWWKLDQMYVSSFNSYLLSCYQMPKGPPKRTPWYVTSPLWPLSFTDFGRTFSHVCFRKILTTNTNIVYGYKVLNHVRIKRIARCSNGGLPWSRSDIYTSSKHLLMEHYTIHARERHIIYCVTYSF